MGRRQIYIFWWDDTSRIYPDLSDEQVRDLIDQKRSEMIRDNIPKIRELEIQVFIGGEMQYINTDVKF